MRLYLLLLTFLATSASSAHAWELTALGGINYASPTDRDVNGTHSWTGNAAVDYGVSAAFQIFDSPFELEGAAFILSSEIQGSVNNHDTVQKMKALHFPLLVRFNFDPWVSLAAGGYLSSGTGSVVTFTDGIPNSQSYSAAGLENIDAGLLIGLKAKLHFTPEISFVFDVRYQHGLQNLETTSPYVYNTRSVQALAGIGFQFITPPPSKDHANFEVHE